MAGTNNTSHSEAPKLSFCTANQTEELKTFYVRALTYLETLDINIDAPEQTKKDGNR